MRNRAAILLACTALALLAACSPSSAEMTPTAARTRTPTPVAPLPTLAPPSASPTLTRIPVTATWTPFPTLAPDLAYGALLEYLDNLEGCEIPCMWGITPGETSLEYLHRHIMPLGQTDARPKENGFWKYRIDIQVPEEVSDFGYIAVVYVTRQESITEALTALSILHPEEDLHWADFLRRFGAPDEIWLTGRPGPGTDTPFGYDLGLQYDHTSLFAEFLGEAPRLEENRFRVCPSSPEFAPTYGPFLITWPRGEKKTPADIRSRDPSWEFLPIDEFETDMTPEKFYTLFIEGRQNACFDVTLPPDFYENTSAFPEAAHDGPRQLPE